MVPGLNCFKCAQQVNGLTDLERHAQQEHYDDLVLKCTKCAHRFATVTAWREHWINCQLTIGYKAEATQSMSVSVDHHSDTSSSPVSYAHQIDGFDIVAISSEAVDVTDESNIINCNDTYYELIANRSSKDTQWLDTEHNAPK